MLVAWLAAMLALRIAIYSGVVGIDAVDEVLRAVLAATVLFGLTGFGLVRLLLPDGLRTHELLWILPVGACATALTMTPLGFVGVPFALNVALVLAAGAALSAVALRRHGLPRVPRPSAIGWPAYLGALLFAVALVPLFRAGFPTVIGDGSDAHLAAGTAEFLRHAHPTATAPELPVDQMPLVWQSKHAIYYAFAAVAALAGLETYETLSTLGALLLTLAGVGMFVLAREMLGAGVAAAAVAMALAGLDRMVLHTGIHPYFNQTWGYLTLPFSIVLSWWVIRHPSRGGIALLGLFLMIGAFAYPLALPIPLWILGVMWWVDRRRRIRRGERLFRARDARAWVGRLPRRVRWPLAVAAFFLLVPIWGVVEKLTQGFQMLTDPRKSLVQWGGDLVGFFPEPQFFAIHETGVWSLAVAAIVAVALWELRRLPRDVFVALASVLAVTALVAGSMRLREYGWYFHFKVLAFVAPLVVVAAAVGLSRMRRWGAVLLVIWITSAVAGARDEVATTFDQLPRTTVALREWGETLPPGASIRLDMQPGAQLWAAYMLHERPLCSQRPLSETSYPHVPLSRAADYVVSRRVRRPFDAVGGPLRVNQEFALYRLRPGLPGGDRCSRRMVQTVQEIQYSGKR